MGQSSCCLSAYPNACYYLIFRYYLSACLSKCLLLPAYLNACYCLQT